MKSLVIFSFLFVVFAATMSASAQCGDPENVPYVLSYQAKVYIVETKMDQVVPIKFDATTTGKFSVTRDANRYRVASLQINGKSAIGGAAKPLMRCGPTPYLVIWEGDADSGDLYEQMKKSAYDKLDEMNAKAKEPQSVGVKVRVMLYPEANEYFNRFNIKRVGDILTFADGTEVDLYSNGENARVELRANDRGDIVIRTYEKAGDVLDYAIIRGKFNDKPTKLP